MNNDLRIQYSIDTEPDFPIPSYSTSGSAGLDLRACLPLSERTSGRVIMPGDNSLISSGFIFEIPDGYEGQLRARSGLSLKHGICLANGVGTIDSDFRGDIAIILLNLGEKPFCVNHGSRVAQLVITAVQQFKCKVVDNVLSTDRGTKGFGSTGEK